MQDIRNAAQEIRKKVLDLHKTEEAPPAQPCAHRRTQLTLLSRFHAATGPATAIFA